MATKKITQGISEKKKNFLKSAAPVGAAAAVGAVAGACISSAQTDPDPEPKPESKPTVDTPLTQETPESNPVYTGPTYQHDPEADSEEQQPATQNVESNTEAPEAQNANGGNQNNPAGNAPSSNEPSANPTSEEVAAMKEIEKDQIDSEDLDVDDAFQVIGFETRTTTEGEEIEVVKVVDVNGNELIMVDTDGNGIYDSVFTMDNEFVGELAKETLTKADMLEKMNPIGYIKPIHEDIPVEIPTGEDIVITDAKDEELEDIVNHMIDDNEQNLMAYTEVDGGNAEETEGEVNLPAEDAENTADDDDDVDYDDTINEEEILAMLDDEVDEEEEESDDDDDSDDVEEDSLDDDMDLDELDA